MNQRSTFRTLSRAAIAAAPRLAGFTQISAWAGNIDPDTIVFPVIGVVTPQERVLPETLEDFERSTLLQIVVKRLGADDLEDMLDDDADAIEPAICGAIMAAGFRCLPEDLTIVLNGDGEQRLGTLMCNFRVTWFRSLAGTS